MLTSAHLLDGVVIDVLGIRYRFAPKGMINSSVGAIYASIANLPRNLCFKKRFTCLLCVIPGPKEPPLTCLNRILEPVVDDLQRCEKGFGVQLYETQEAAIPRVARVCAKVLFNVSDLPATKKLIGAVGLSSNTRPCHHCSISKKDINTFAAYNWFDLPHKHSPSTLLWANFAYEDATTDQRRSQIETRYGVRFSIMSRLSGFDQGASNPVDPLHNSFLGLVRSYVSMLCKAENGLMEGFFADGTARMDVFREVFETAYYPGHLSRLPARVTQQFTSSKKRAGAGLKADQWKRVSQVMVLALWAAWRSEQGDDSLEDIEQPLEEEDPETVSQDRSRWFNATVSLAAGLRILHAHNIALREAEAAVDDIANTAKEILTLKEHLTINWHNAMHYAE